MTEFKLKCQSCNHITTFDQLTYKIRRTSKASTRWLVKQILCPICGTTLYWLPYGTPTWQDKLSGIWFEPIDNKIELNFGYPPLHASCGSLVLPVFYQEISVRSTIECIQCRTTPFYQINPNFCATGWKNLSKKNEIIQCLLKNVCLNNFIFICLDQNAKNLGLEFLQQIILSKYRNPNNYRKNECQRDFFLPPLPPFKNALNQKPICVQYWHM